MKLHEDRLAFETLILNLSEQHSIRRDIIEKDYYVTMVLHELAVKQASGLPVYFKGGTALYKALKSIRRFSEDIDLTVRFDELWSKTKKHKTMENAANRYALPSDGDPEWKGVGAITCHYRYESLFEIDASDRLARFGKLKVEATSFTVSEPISDLQIAPMVYELSAEKNRRMLTTAFDVSPFLIKTVTLERIFVDKVFAAEYYYRRPGEYLNAAKHVYDLTVLLNCPNIQTFLYDASHLAVIVALKRREELSRLGGIPAEWKVSGFSYLDDALTNPGFVKAYEQMQKIYVFNPADRIELATLSETMILIKERFVKY